MDFTQIIGSELKNQALSQIAQKIGGDNATAQKLISAALPSVLGALEKNTSTQEGVQALDTALSAHTGTSSINIQDGEKILGHLLGGETQTEIENIAAKTGATPTQSGQVMSMLSSLVMEKLGDQKAAGLDGNAIAKLLSGSSKSTSQMLGMFLDQDGDGDFDSQDAVKFGMKWIQQKFLGKK